MRLSDFCLAAGAAFLAVWLGVTIVNATPDLNLKPTNGLVMVKDAVVPQ